MKARVLIALALFVHLLAHPILHAADSQLAITSHASPFAAQVSLQSTPECAFCHVAGVLHVNSPVATILADLDTASYVLASRHIAKRDGADLLPTTCAPPAL